MLDVKLDTRRPIDRLVLYLYEYERKHLLESIEDDLSNRSDAELYEHCITNDIDHIWLDVYMVQQLIKEDEDDTGLDTEN